MIQWRNFPIPEQFIIALLAGGLLQVTVPTSLRPPGWVWVVVSGMLIITGSVIIARSIIFAHENDLAHPIYLLTGGPYAFSRNPMYLAWVMFAFGIAILVNSLWLAVVSLVATLYINFVTIPREERYLQGRFGEEYTAYRQDVRRWL